MAEDRASVRACEPRDDGRVTAGCACDHSVSAVDEFAYFMIRVRREAGKGAEDVPLTGVIERLGSGEKSAFDGSEELLQRMTDSLSRDAGVHARGSNPR
jgi:hypothetical protein